MLLQVFMRAIEFGFILRNFGYQDSLAEKELLGLVVDLLFTNSGLLVSFPIWYLINENWPKLAFRLWIGVLMILIVIHYFIIQYFVYQLVPLNTFLFEYPLKEILFTLNTSDTSYVFTAIVLLVFLVSSWLGYRFLVLNTKFIPRIFVLFVFYISLPMLLIFGYFELPSQNFSINKSQFFYTRTGEWLFSNKSRVIEKDILAFQKRYPNKNYLGSAYPFLHSFEPKNSLEPYLKSFDTKPNIVLLIVEGLNDDYIHQYNGLNLMPFTNSLAQMSLYWNHAFTLGERSFAAVPSLTGSLPYGSKGFTLLNKLPQHLSLVSVLGSNQYQSNFFYGQGAWFHQKDRFFRFNHIENCIDNSKFNAQFEKIIVGSDNFFWGYNDKDLFKQALQFTNSIQHKPRLDIYFTGTSHNPFRIANKEAYEARYTALIANLPKEQKKFFETYRKYLLTELFVDDALKDFFEDYKTRSDFKNTLFIVTGDHPMTEVPVTNSLKRYHVPLIIYSPKLKQAQVFSSRVSHLDVYETLLSYLQAYGVKAPAFSTALGSGLLTTNSEMGEPIAFMNDNRQVIDYLSGHYYLAQNNLFEVDENLNLVPCNNSLIRDSLVDQMEVFRKLSEEVCLTNKLLPDTLYCQALQYKYIFSKNDLPLGKEYSKEFTNLFEGILIPNSKNELEISFDFKASEHKNLQLIVEARNLKDSTFFYYAAGISPQETQFQTRIVLPKISTKEKSFKLKAFIWNQELKRYFLQNTHTLLYTPNR